MQLYNETQSHFPEWLEKGSQYNLNTGTNDYYKKFVTDDNYPIVGVSWNDADAYCKWLSRKTGMTFKLPTEAQWEKAARGVDGRKYPWGNSDPTENLVNFNNNIGKISSVGSFPQGTSPYGALDMAGNIWEWCRDWYKDDYYKNSIKKKNPIGPVIGTNRVLRGGSWFDDARILCCANRNYGPPAYRAVNFGFRLLQDN